MIQTHTIVLWRMPELEEKSFDSLARNSFELMSVFQDFDCEWRPNYLTGYKKNKTKFQWNYNNFSEELKKGVNREGKKAFSHLGYQISFYSSLIEDKSFGHSLTIGSTRFFNVLTVKIANDFNLYDNVNAKKMERLFEKLVERFNPFWGCVANSKIASKYGYFDQDNNIPQTVYWLNYFNENIIENIGKERIDNVLSEYSSMSFKNGLLRLCSIPIDYESEEDVQFHEEIHSSLILS